MINYSNYIKGIHEILKILNYPVEKQYVRVNDFINIVKISFLRHILEDYTGINKKDISSLAEEAKNFETLINGLTKQIREELTIQQLNDILNQTCEELFRDYLNTVLPQCEEETREEIASRLSELNISFRG